jgi:hypothetical protein
MKAPAVVLAAVALLGTAAGGDQARGTQEGARQRAPGSFTCDRNDLTSYTGVVRDYRRGTDSTALTIRTDFDTTERVLLKHPGTDDPSRFFRMQGEPFTSADWSRIESKKGVLREGTRASAWVCADGRVMVDWGVPSDTRGRQR